MCEELLGPHADHGMVCPCGPLTKACHDSLADTYASFIEETGAKARREAYILELTTPASEAWMDVWGMGSAEIWDLLLDVTVRHPAAERYQPRAAEEPGAACLEASKEKHERYPSRGGRAITPVCAETWGRWGPEAEDVLARLSAAASRRDHLRGASQTGRMQRWRARLDAVLQRGVVARLLSCSFGLPGRRASGKPRAH